MFKNYVASWYRRIASDYTEIIHPLSQLMKKKMRWDWAKEQQEVFDKLKQKLTEAPVVACPDFAQRCIVQTDANSIDLKAILTQMQGSVEKVITYANRCLHGTESNYSATEKEYLPTVWANRKLRPYLEDYYFKIITDH